jgi:hypothetical protein
MPRCRIEPIIHDTTLSEFSAFLHRHLDPSRSAAEWNEALRQNWSAVRPNYGFLMRGDADQVVGGIGAIYADRRMNGRVERFCNITSWCVLEAYRKQSMRLAMALVGQGDYHYTDFSPTQVVGAVLRFLKFKPIDERQTVMLNLPVPGGVAIEGPSRIEATLAGETLDDYRAHRKFPWLNHLVIGRDSDWCYVIYKRLRYKGLPSALVVHVSNEDALHQSIGALRRHLLFRGMATTHIETRRLRRSPLLSGVRSGFNARLFLSSTLVASQIDYLYSETVAMDL